MKSLRDVFEEKAPWAEFIEKSARMTHKMASHIRVLFSRQEVGVVIKLMEVE